MELRRYRVRRRTGRTMPGTGLSLCGTNASRCSNYVSGARENALAGGSHPARAWMSEAKADQFAGLTYYSVQRFILPSCVTCTCCSPLPDPPGHRNPADFPQTQRRHALGTQLSQRFFRAQSLRRASFDSGHIDPVTLKAWWSVMLPGGYWVWEDEIL